MCIDNASKTCCVFGHPLYHLAMACMVVGFIMSGFGIFTVLGLLLYVVPFIIFSSSCCCAMGKGCFITGGVLATISGVIGLFFSLGTIGVGVVGVGGLCSDEDNDVSDANDWWNTDNSNNGSWGGGDADDVGCVAAIAFLLYGISAGLWLLAAILFFGFACCGPHDRIAEELRKREAIQVVQVSTQPITQTSLPNNGYYQAQTGTGAPQHTVPQPTETVAIGGDAEA